MPGQSGAPIIKVGENGDLSVVGIHKGGYNKKEATNVRQVADFLVCQQVVRSCKGSGWVAFQGLP